MIDLRAATRRFSGPLTAQSTLMVPVFERLARAIDTLAKDAAALESTTRAYPVLRYRDGAVGVRLHLADDARFVPVAAGLSFGEGLRDGGRRFMAGLRLVPTAVEQDLALPRLLGMTEEALAAVDASLERHLTATPGLFDPRQVTFSDVFGIANLAWSSLLGEANQTQLRTAGHSALAALDVVAVLRGPAPGAAGSAEPGAPDATATGPDRGPLGGLETLPTDALLLLPLVVPLVDVVLADGMLAAQRTLVAELSAAVDPPLRELRAGVIDAWLAAFEVGTTAQFAVAAAELVVGANRLLLEWGFDRWFDGLVTGITVLGRGITIWGVYSRAVLTVFQTAADAMMGVDLMPWVARNLLPGWLASRIPLPTVTIGDVVDLVSGHGDPRIRDAVVEVLDQAADILRYVPFTGDLDRRVAGARDIADLVLTPTRFTYPPDVVPTTPLAGFPDVYEAFFGGGRRDELLRSVRGLGDETRAGVTGTLRAAQGLATGLAAASVAEGERQARLGAGLHLPERERAQRAIVGNLFAALRSDVQARLAGAPADALAHAFEAAVAGGGITTAAAAVPVYVGRLRDHWAVRTEAGPHPTSAHVLARRGRFAGVRVPRLTLQAHGRTPDEALADVTAQQFRGAVAGAYREGRARMVALQAEAAPQSSTRSVTRPPTRAGGGGRGRR